MKSIIVVIAMLCLVSTFEMEEKRLSKMQKKAMEAASKEAVRNKAKAMRLVKSSSGAKKQFITTPINAYVNDLECGAYHTQPQICTSISNCGYCTQSQHCIMADMYGAGVESCPRTYYIFDNTVWNDPLMMNYNPFGRGVVPLYSHYYDFGAPFYQDNFYYPTTTSFYYRLKKRHMKKKAQ